MPPAVRVVLSLNLSRIFLTFSCHARHRLRIVGCFFKDAPLALVLRTCRCQVCIDEVRAWASESVFGRLLALKGITFIRTLALDTDC